MGGGGSSLNTTASAQDGATCIALGRLSAMALQASKRRLGGPMVSGV